MSNFREMFQGLAASSVPAAGRRPPRDCPRRPPGLLLFREQNPIGGASLIHVQVLRLHVSNRRFESRPYKNTWHSKLSYPRIDSQALRTKGSVNKRMNSVMVCGPGLGRLGGCPVSMSCRRLGYIRVIVLHEPVHCRLMTVSRR